MEPAFPFFVGTETSTGPGLYRMLLVQEGALRLQCGKQTSTLLPGTLLLIPPRSGHRLLKSMDTTVRGFSFSRSLVDPLTLGSSVELGLELLGVAGARAAQLPPAEYREACALFAFIEREGRERRPGYQAMLRLKLMETILLLYRARHGTGGAGEQTPLRFHLAEVQRFLQDSCADELSLSGIASRNGMNPSYFSRLFHREAGVPLVAYINRIRIQKSCLLLKRTRTGILEIALSVGYNNVSHFNRYFRRLIGMSPREYRAQSEK